MKVYVVTKGDYDYKFCCVCLDRETAQKRARLFDDDLDTAKVEEHDTDEYQAFTIKNGKISRNDGKELFKVTFHEYVDNGEKHKGAEIEEREINVRNIKGGCFMDDMWYLASNGDYVKGNCWICFVYARDKIEALKTACECVEKKIAERGETHATD